MLSTEDRLAIQELLALYGHVIDERQWSRMDEVFTADVEFDPSGDGEITRSLVELREVWSTDDHLHPLAHHATNIVIQEDPAGVVRVVSKGLGIGYKGRVGSVTYYDTLRHTPDGWRVATRRAQIRRPEALPPPS